MVFLFDSNLYVFLTVAVEDYKDPAQSKWKVMLVRNFFAYAERWFKSLVQLCMGAMVWNSFMPYWSETVSVCDANSSNGDTVLALMGTLLYYITLFPILHLVLNTFIYGQSPSWLEPGMKLRDGRTVKEEWGRNYQTSKEDDLYEHDPEVGA